MRLTAVDNAWLRMERPENLMMVSGVLTFDEPLDLVRLRAILTHRLRWFPRFAQRIVGDRWEDAGAPDLDYHLVSETLAAPADRTVLRKRISELVSTPIDFDRPPWRMHVLENPDGRTVLLCRIHHCIADGFALMYVMLGLTDDTPDAPVQRSFEKASSPGGGFRDRVAELGRVSWRIVRSARAQGVITTGKRTQQIGMDLVRLATLSSQPKTCLRGGLGTHKAAAWSAPVPLSQVKAIGRAFDGTVNDALMTAVAGALRRYVVARGESGFELRGVVPVNLRSEDEMRQLGNHFGLVFLELPLQVDDPRERFRLVKARMDQLKRSPEAMLLWHLMQVTGAGPAWLEEAVVRLLGAKSTAVMTNVPGPRQPRYLAGQRIQTIMFWVPQSGRVGLGVSVFSYAGQVRLGLAVDAGLVPDPETILDAFPAELEALAECVELDLTGLKS